MPTTASLPATTLYYKDGSSDKVYQCKVEAKGSGFIVNFAFGRRGATLATGTKTSSPVSMEEAEKIFNKLIREKTSKGYTPGEDGKVYTQTEHAGKRSSNVPQLLNMITEAEAIALINNPDYVAQEKHDGQRMILAKEADVIQASNKKGLVTNFPDEVRDALLPFKANFTIDGEMIGETHFIFDALSLPGVPDLHTKGVKERYLALAEFAKGKFPTTGIGETKPGTLFLVPMAITTQEKQAMFDALRKKGKEGIVFKKATAAYVAGRPASCGSQLKFKFYETASVKVIRVNAQRSVSVAVLDKATWTDIGNVTIPPNHALPQVDDVVEVRYLYAFKGGSIFQSAYLGKRVDVDAEECTVDQLKYKSE